MDKSVISSKTTKPKGPLLKVVLVGDSEVGKSTIISTFINQAPPKEKFKKSVGIDSVLNYIEVKNKKWDTAGEDKLRTMISSYYRGVHALIIVYDYTNINSFYSLKNWLREIKQFAPDNCVKYLVCNKIDKFSPDTTTNASTNWMISEEEVEKFAKINSLNFVKVSAVSNTGIQELFFSLTEEILNTTDNETLNIRSESFKIQLINGEYFHKDNKIFTNTNNKFSVTNKSDCCFRII